MGAEGGAGGDASADQASAGFGSQFVHLVQSSGFQLINVNNVAIRLNVRLAHRIIPDSSCTCFQVDLGCVHRAGVTSHSAAVMHGRV